METIHIHSESDQNRQLSDVPPARLRKKGMAGGVMVLVGGFILGFAGGILSLVAYPSLQTALNLPALPSWPQTSSEKNGAGEQMERTVSEDAAVIQTVEQTSPGVVSVVITRDMPQVRSFFGNPFGMPFFFEPFGEGPQDNSGGTQKQTVGQGSGFIISSDGMIVTNKHVVQEGDAEYTVLTNDGKEYSARVLARDPNNDIAVLKIDAQDLPALDLGDSEALRVGQTVIAIGNSLGEFSNTVSKGIVSGLRRNVVAGSGLGDTERLSNIIQTDAAINPGNSGGPLLDVSGKVIGVNVAMAQGAENIGFAIPINQVKRVIDQVRTTGKISTPYLGIRYLTLDAALQKENNLPFDYGSLVLRGERMTDFAVVPGSPADKAGIMENDIILEMDGVKITKDRQIGDLLAERRAGDEVTLKVWHRGEIRELKVKLEERPQL
jgi:serine protease Do